MKMRSASLVKLAETYGCGCTTIGFLNREPLGARLGIERSEGLSVAIYRS